MKEQESTLDMASLTDGSRERAFGEALATLMCAIVDHGQFSAETKAAIRAVAKLYATDTGDVAKLAHEGMTRLATALHTAEGNYQWLCENFQRIQFNTLPVPHFVIRDLKTQEPRPYHVIESLVSAERQRETSHD